VNAVLARILQRVLLVMHEPVPVAAPRLIRKSLPLQPGQILLRQSIAPAAAANLRS